MSGGFQYPGFSYPGFQTGSYVLLPSGALCLDDDSATIAANDGAPYCTISDSPAEC